MHSDVSILDKVKLSAESALTMTETQFISNTSLLEGGGVFVSCVSCAATLNGGLFQNNRSMTSYGGGLYAFSTLALTSTQFISNTAGLGGGGIYHTSNTARVVNALFVSNAATNTLGTALYLNSPSNVQILHTTIVSPTLVNGSAIHITAGNVGITNTIVASHTVGISNTGGTAYQDYNLLFNNTSDTGGTVSGGTHNVNGDPRFINPFAGDYHLKITSPAIDAGANVGVTTDIDGRLRPLGGYDIGCYEAGLRLYLPLIMR